MIPVVLIVISLILSGLAIQVGSWVIYGKIFKIKNISIPRALKAVSLIVLLNIVCITAIKFSKNVPEMEVAVIIALILFSLIILKYSLKTTVAHTIGIQLFSIMLTIVFSLFIKTYVIKAYKIPSGSMAPTIIPGDHILSNKFIFKFFSLDRGDVIVCKSPKNENSEFIERIVAIGGDQVEIIDKTLFINGQKHSEPYAVHSDSRIFNTPNNPRDNFGPITIPENQFFVMGDNRDNSYDSRFWGSIPIRDIHGKAFIIYWSKNSISQETRTSRIGTTL